MLLCDDSFIFSVSIILISIQLFVFFNPRMPSEYYCPNCKSENVFVYDDHIECAQCGLNFFIKDIENDIDEENLLSEQELKGFVDAFNELKDEETRRRFLKSLDEDLEDFDE